MNCAPFDLRDYFFGELNATEAKVTESHVATCEGCRTELDRLDVTRVAMLELPSEEVPRRISFVSDKVFEPSLWQRFWQSGPKVGFASALLIFAGLLVNALPRQTAPAVQPLTATSYSSIIDAKVQEEVAKRLPVAVAQAVSDVQSRDTMRLTTAVASVEQKYQMQRREDMAAMQATLDVWQRKLSRMYLASYDPSPVGSR